MVALVQSAENAGCLLRMKDWRILHLLHRNLQPMFGRVRLFFLFRRGAFFKVFSCNVTPYSLDVEPFSKYSPVMLHLTPATRILNEDPENVHQVLKLEEKLMYPG